MKVEVVKDVPGGMTTKNEMAYKVVKELYESENDCIRVTDEEKEFKDVSQMRNVLNEQARKYSQEVLNAHGIRISQMFWLNPIMYRNNAFKVRKEPCKAVVYVKVERYTEKELDDLKLKIEAEKIRRADRRERK